MSSYWSVIEIDLSKILLEKVEEDFQKRRKEVVNRSESLKLLLTTIAKAGKWYLTTNVRGMDTHHPEIERDLELLEGSGLIESSVKYTKHNSYREYSVTKRGKVIVSRL